MKAYSNFLDFLLYKLKGKAGTSKFSSAVGLNLFNQRTVVLEGLRASCKGWKSMKERNNILAQMKKQAQTVIQPNMSKDIENCVSNWHLSDEYKSRMEAFTRLHEKCVKTKTKPSKAEYEDAVAIVGTEISICNGNRASGIGNITNQDYYMGQKRYNVSLHNKLFYSIE